MLCLRFLLSEKNVGAYRGSGYPSFLSTVMLISSQRYSRIRDPDAACSVLYPDCFQMSRCRSRSRVMSSKQIIFSRMKISVKSALLTSWQITFDLNKIKFSRLNIFPISYTVTDDVQFWIDSCKSLNLANEGKIFGETMCRRRETAKLWAGRVVVPNTVRKCCAVRDSRNDDRKHRQNFWPVTTS